MSNLTIVASMLQMFPITMQSHFFITTDLVRTDDDVKVSMVGTRIEKRRMPTCPEGSPSSSCTFEVFTKHKE